MTARDDQVLLLGELEEALAYLSRAWHQQHHQEITGDYDTCWVAFCRERRALLLRVRQAREGTPDAQA